VTGRCSNLFSEVELGDLGVRDVQQGPSDPQGSDGTLFEPLLGRLLGATQDAAPAISSPDAERLRKSIEQIPG
jgi:hypothetical protein